MSDIFDQWESQQKFGASASMDVRGCNGFTHLQADAYSWSKQSENRSWCIPSTPCEQPQPAPPAVYQPGYPSNACTGFSSRDISGVRNYYDGVNTGTASWSGSPRAGAAAWGASNELGSSMGGVGWGTDCEGRTHGGGSMNWVAPDGSVGQATLRSVNGQGELDWTSSTGSGALRWGPNGWYSSYSVPVNPNNRRCW